MSEKGIIFCTELIPKILDGTKTVTRRCHKKLMYQPGDVLYLRECYIECELEWFGHPGKMYSINGITYRADMITVTAKNTSKPMPTVDGVLKQVGAWKSGRFMPKWAARPNRYLVVDARMEPLWDITEEDAKREGVEPGNCAGGPYRNGFLIIWHKLNGRRPGWTWDNDPTVARYEFKEIK